ncbi:MAG: bifunctional [glutamine synthetase] adenylyltransferase/[glutamine synthetase]-adenylyl-L-tyrosine phosphorylase, partial [Micrococcales bacterium]|nr:bifunctional [glutamine synthetase] adenylyltransferase/[glutamine synthetase]-adenylyl-L-tyrosine phosphorylase [Micrococcales bacterium]
MDHPLARAPAPHPPTSARAQALLRELATAGHDLMAHDDGPSRMVTISRAADPDQALLALTRIAATAGPHLRTVVDDDDAFARLIAVLGVSDALGDHLVRHPEHLEVLVGEESRLERDAEEVRDALLDAVGVRGERTPTDALRVAYRRRLLEIAAHDLVSDEPAAIVDIVGRALADLAAGALEAGLAIVRSQVERGATTRLAVMGMGKCGGRELNYVSDVDVMYVTADEGDLAVATELAGRLQRVCGGASGEPALWTVDANLRPEGRDGPLVRSLESYRAYYERWAKTWEFQALLKERVVAGDREVGEAFVQMTTPMVWACVEREGFVEEAQAMRRRVESQVPEGEAERQIKLGRGGLRDVEFTVQLLQLVHGRGDESIRCAGTLEALAALAAGGYVGRKDAHRLGECYRMLRVLEHRVQVRRLRRTHLLPTDPGELRRLARAARLAPGAETRAARLAPGAGDQVMEVWAATRREVRALHQEVFYRPLLPETARLTADEAVLAPSAARARLTALGYRDPGGALAHIAALTQGVSRRASIQRQLLPVMLGWFAEGADPDAGLLLFRRVSEELGATPWYLRMLRDSAGAAEHLSQVLATSRFVGEGLAHSPDSVLWFGDAAKLVPRGRAELDAEIASLVARHPEAIEGAREIRAVRRRELVRIAAGVLVEGLATATAAQAVTSVTEASLAGALRLAEAHALAGLVPGLPARDTAPTRLAVVAMGSFGGREMGLSSDADVLWVHDPAPNVDDDEAQVWAVGVAGLVRSLLGDLGPQPPLEVDGDLRPEGRAGPLARSLAAYQEYYERWASPWERQALLRARPLAGDASVLERFVPLADSVRYRPSGVSNAELTELRRLKARVDSERLPRGVEPRGHLKLGPGG